MKKLILLSLSAACALAAHATTYTFQPNPTDLNDLDHTQAYIWGITSSALKSQLNSGYSVTSATITITGLYNWDAGDTNNMLFINLLDNPAKNVTSVTDDAADQGVNEGTVSNYFAGNITSNHGTYYSGAASLLTTYHDNDGPTTSITLTYNFTSAQLTLLGNYITDATTAADFGLGFDPDCHYYNTGITLTLNTAKVPDGSMTLVLLGLGLAALSGGRRFFRRS